MYSLYMCVCMCVFACARVCDARVVCVCVFVETIGLYWIYTVCIQMFP